MAYHIPYPCTQAEDGPRLHAKEMTMIKSFDDALDFFPRPEHRSPLSRFGNGLRTYWSALGDGLVAARRYHQLTAREWRTMKRSPRSSTSTSSSLSRKQSSVHFSRTDGGVGAVLLDPERGGAVICVKVGLAPA